VRPPHPIVGSFGAVRRAIASVVAFGALLLPGSAAALDYAPVDTPGPPLSPSQAELDASLDCSSAAALDGASKAPVLLVHGTGSDPEHNFAWNWEPALDALDIPWCTVALVDHGMADIQDSGEYVVNAIRTMYQRAGRKIAILGHSQGGMIPRWALRFWPDTRAMVDDVVGFAPSNHGTDGANTVCNPDCSPAFWQQASGSELIKAVNSFQETFSGISYTVAYTHTDWVVTPNQDATTGSSSLRGGDGEISNIAIQDICPTDLNEHLAIGTIDNVAYRIAIDALENAGPADPSRLDPIADPSICLTPFQPGVNPATVATDEASSAADLFGTIATYPHVSSEPPLKCYVTASCPRASREKRRLPASRG
jgi:triacylglycerol esterase/lipase EstA (alpha/beta hydrolase family)